MQTLWSLRHAGVAQFTSLHQTRLSEQCGAKCDSGNINYTCSKEIGLHLQILFTTPHSTVNTKPGGAEVEGGRDSFKESKRIHFRHTRNNTRKDPSFNAVFGHVFIIESNSMPHKIQDVRTHDQWTITNERKT